MIDSLRLYGDQFAALFPGEPVLAALTVAYQPGEELVGPQPPNSIAFDIVSGLQVDAWNRGLERLLGGRTLVAQPGQEATRLVAAAAGHPELVLTSTRLAAVDDLISGPGRVVWSCPRHLVTRLRHDPVWNQRGRMTLTFADGSLARIHAGYLFAGTAKRFVAAFEQGRRPAA